MNPVVAAIGVLALAGCGVGGELAADDRVEIRAPVPLQLVTTPVEIEWQAEGISADLTYAVFLDRDPIPPDTSLAEAFVDECDGIDSCPDRAFLQQQNIFLTEETTLAVARAPILGGVGGAARAPVHRATIVLVDADGVRRGEGHWSVEFRLDDR